MNPIALKLRNLRTFDTLDLDLPAGCCAITGEILNAPDGVGSNGAGKSTIPLAIELALFGPPSGFRSLADFLTAGGAATDLEVELTVSHGGDLFRVRRGYSARGRGKSSLDFEQLEPTTALWLPLTRESIKETQAQIESTFGMTQRIYRCSSYLAQGDADAFVGLPPGERIKALVESVLGRDPIWTRLADRVRADQRAKEAQLAKLGARLEQAEQELHEQAEVMAAVTQAQAGEHAAAQALERAEKQLADLTEKWQRADRRVAERRAAEAEHEAAVKERQRLRDQAEQAESARESIRGAQERLAGLADADALAQAEQRYSEARAEYDRAAFERQTLESGIRASEEQDARLEQERQALLLQREDILRKASALEEDPGTEETCPTCKRLLDDPDARHRVIESYWADVSDLDARRTVLVAAIQSEAGKRVKAQEALWALGKPVAPSDFEVTRAREQVTERAVLEERLGRWQQAVDEVHADDFRARNSESESNFAAAAAKLAALPPIDQTEIDRIKREGLEARARVNEQRQRLDEARTEKTRLEERLERLGAVEAQARIEREAKAGLQQDLDVLALLARAYGEKGIPALIVDAIAIPVLADTANDLLAELGTPFRVELRTQRAQKTTDALADTLDIVVVDQHGNEREYLSYSQGERERVGLALRIALACYMQTRGEGSGLLALDEPSGLDAQGVAALVRVLHRLSASVFEKVYLISHDQLLRDAFDNVLHIVRDEDGRSSVDTAATAAEPVMAATL